MPRDSITYRPEQPADTPIIEALHAEAFGPGRFARAAFRVREMAAHDPDFSFVAEADGGVIASVRVTRIAIGERPALLLGPLAVLPSWKGRGAGKRLVAIVIEAARAGGHAAIVLVGDLSYYGPLGFVRQPGTAIGFPAPVDPARVLVCEVSSGALDGLAGIIGVPR